MKRTNAFKMMGVVMAVAMLISSMSGITIAYATDSAQQTGDYGIYSENFDGKTADDLASAGWTVDASKVNLTNNTLEFTGKTEIKKTILSAEDQQEKIRIAYDITVKKWQDTMTAINLISGESKLAVNAFYYFGQVGGINSSADGAVRLNGMALNTKYNVVNVVDLANQTIETKLTAPDGSVITATKEGFKIRNTETDLTGTITDLSIEAWGDNFTLDNLAVEYYVLTPDDYKIYSENFDGKTADDLASAGWTVDASKVNLTNNTLEFTSRTEIKKTILSAEDQQEKIRIAYDITVKKWQDTMTAINLISGESKLAVNAFYYFGQVGGINSSADGAVRLNGMALNTKYNVVNVVDLANQTIETKLTAPDGSVITATKEGFKIRNTETDLTGTITDLSIEAWGDNFTLDNLNVEYYYEIPEPSRELPLNEGFDYTSVSQMQLAGWQAGVAGGVSTELTDNIVTIDTETFKDDVEHGNTIQIKNQNSINYLFDEARTRVTVKFDFYQSADDAAFRLNFSKNGTEAGGSHVVGAGIVGYGPGGKKTTAGDMFINTENWGANNQVIPMKRELNTWYTYEVDFVMAEARENNFYNVKIYQGDKLVGNYRNVKFPSWGHIGAVKQISIDLLGDGGNNTWFDNVEVYETDTAPKLEDYLIYSENFDGKTADGLIKDGWTGDAGKINIANNALEFTDSTEVKKTILGSGNQQDKIRISYDVTVKKWQDTMTAVNLMSGTSKLGVNIYYYFGQVGGQSSTNDGAVKLEGMQLDTKYGIENVVDLNNKTITTTMTAPDGTATTFVKEGFKVRNTATDITGTIDTLSIEAWNDNFTLDNLVVEYYYDKPAVSDAGVVFKSIDGSTIEKTAAMPGDIYKVEVNTGVEVTDESAKASVTLTSAGDTPDYNVEVSANNVVVTLNKALKPNTEYTLSVGQNLCNELNLTLGKNYNYTFKTGEGCVKVVLDGIYSDNTKLSTIGELTAGGKAVVKAKVVNSTANSSAISVIGAFFAGNIFKDAVMYPSSLEIGRIGEFEQEIDIPEDLTGFTLAEIYLWDSITGMKPYCAEIALPQQ